MTNEREKNAYDQLLQGIQSFVKKCVNESNRDITTTARIVSIQSDGSYNIDLNGVEYKNIDTIGGECTLNEMVRVVMPQGQYNNMFILKGGSSSGSITPTPSVSGVLSVNGKTGDVTLNYNDVGALSNSYKTKVDDVYTKAHEHSNKAVLDATTASFTLDDQTKLTNIENGAQKNTVTGVKGATEEDYRVGNVNITKTNIGLENVANERQWSEINHPTTMSGYGITDGVSSTDYNTLKGRVDTNEDNIAMLDSDVEGIITDVGTLKTDMTTVKGAVTTIQDSLNDKLSKTETAAKATADASGNTITTSYASTIEISGDTLTLKSKSGVVLKTVTLPSSTLQWNE
jgi:hypothetical protein